MPGSPTSRHDLALAGLGLGQAARPGSAARRSRPTKRDARARAPRGAPGGRPDTAGRRAGRHELEAPGEERRGPAAHDRHARRGQVDEGVEHGARAPLGVRVELDAGRRPGRPAAARCGARDAAAAARDRGPRARRDLLQRRAATWAARRGASSSGSSPNAATHAASERARLTWPPKLCTLSRTASIEPAHVGCARRAVPRLDDATRSSVTRRDSQRTPAACAGARATGAAGRSGGSARRGGRRRRPAGAQPELLGAIAQRVARDARAGVAARERFQPVALERLEEPRRAPARARVPAKRAEARRRRRRGAERPSAAALTRAPSVRRATRSITLASSRTFPGQGWASRAARASGASVARRQPVVVAGRARGSARPGRTTSSPRSRSGGKRGARPRRADGRGPRGSGRARTAARRSSLVAAMIHDVDRLAARAAEAPHRALLDAPSAACLQRDRQEPDLVEEQRAAVRGLEEAGLAWRASVNAPFS